MVKVALCRFQQSSGRFAMFVLELTFKRDFTDIYLITFSADGNLGNTSALSVIFFGKGSKFNVDCKNAEKNSEKVFCFLDNSI